MAKPSKQDDSNMVNEKPAAEANQEQRRTEEVAATTAVTPVAKAQAMTPAATERPVPSAPEKAKPESQYVVTVDDSTGTILKIERLSASGERKELSQDEYTQVQAYAHASFVGLAGQMQTAASDPLVVRAFFHGMSDYFGALSK